MSPGRRNSSRRRRLDDVAPVFAALGDATRLALVRRLALEPSLSISELTSETGVTRQAISHHLEVLEDAGLVRGTRAGREHVWRLEAAQLALAQRSLAQISRWWDDRLAALKDIVEER